MTDPTPRAPAGGEGVAPAAASTGGHAHGIDVERLADKVYRLMRDELRLELARGAGAARGRRDGRR